MKYGSTGISTQIELFIIEKKNRNIREIINSFVFIVLNRQF